MASSRTELLEWINDLLQLNYTKVPTRPRASLIGCCPRAREATMSLSVWLGSLTLLLSPSPLRALQVEQCGA